MAKMILPVKRGPLRTFAFSMIAAAQNAAAIMILIYITFFFSTLHGFDCPWWLQEKPYLHFPHFGLKCGMEQTPQCQSQRWDFAVAHLGDAYSGR